MWWVVYVAAWVMMNGMSSLSTDIWSNLYAPDPPPYPEQTFDLSLILTKKAYSDLIIEMRSMLTYDMYVDPMSFKLPRLVNPDTVARTRRFFLVKLINASGNTITVAIDTTRVFVVGYRRGDEFHYFPDTAQHVHTTHFPDIPHILLPFGSSYGALEQLGGGRSTTHLGSSLGQAIDDLFHYRTRYLARSFTIIIQMISEAIRFRYIENFVGNLIARGVTAVPDRTMLELENEWGSFSDRIQHSVSGTLNPPVTLTDPGGRRGAVSNVNQGLAGLIGILFFVCYHSPYTDQLSLISTNISEPIIRLPIEKAAGDSCKNIGEPTVRIVGRNGDCAEVRGGLYIDRNSIIMSPCKSNDDVDQLWTVKIDGTIRSNGKCLSTSSYTTINYVMIDSCNGLVPDSTKWDIWDNGTIFHPASRLVLSARMVGVETTLNLQLNSYAIRQGWVVTNNTGLTVIRIMNNNEDMCLEAPDYDNSRILYRGCQSGERRQSFAVYPDGTIRPDKTRHNCFTAAGDSVFTASCSEFSNGQRWSFNRDYTISPLNTRLAIDARNNVISLYPRQSIDSQMWQPWFFSSPTTTLISN